MALPAAGLDSASGAEREHASAAFGCPVCANLLTAAQETNTLTKAQPLCQPPNHPQELGRVRSRLLLFIELNQMEGNCRFSSPEVFLEY